MFFHLILVLIDGYMEIKNYIELIGLRIDFFYSRFVFGAYFLFGKLAFKSLVDSN
jgi:hypothetical protein